MRKHQLTLKLIGSYSSGLHKKVAFEILGLQSNAHPLEIKEAYLKLSKKFHPDVSSVMNAAEMFKKINEAYNTLKKDAHETESFSSGINKNPKYNFEDSSANEEDYEVYKKYTSRREPEPRSAFINRNLNSFSSSSSSYLRRDDPESRSQKFRGTEQQTLKGRMAKFMKQ